MEVILDPVLVVDEERFADKSRYVDMGGGWFFDLKTGPQLYVTLEYLPGSSGVINEEARHCNRQFGSDGIELPRDFDGK